jgi:hypothetical protein
LSTYLSTVEEASPSAILTKCPYKNANSVYCLASVMIFPISNRQNGSYCSTENYDSCPVFLGKVLREARVKPQL